MKITFDEDANKLRWIIKSTMRLAMFVLAFHCSTMCTYAVAPPTVSPSTGTYTSNQAITMGADTGVDIYYTLNGSQPSNTSTHYTASFTVSSPSQINAIAYDSSTSTYSTVTTNYLDVNAALAPIAQTGLVLRLRA